MSENRKDQNVKFCFPVTSFSVSRRHVERRGQTAGKLIAAIGCAALVQFSVPSQALTVREAVQAAIQTNPDVGIVIESRRAVQQEVEQAKGVLYPQLDARIAYGHEWVTDPATRARARDNTRDLDVTALPRSEVGITISQLLFDGFAAIREIDRQKARVRSSTRRVCETSELIGLDTIEAYLEALRQRELVTLARRNVGIHENHLKLTRSKVAGGACSQADVEQADSRLASARDNLAEAEGRMVDADTTYKRIVGERRARYNGAAGAYRRSAADRLDSLQAKITGIGQRIERH
jgi:adhesin transport system outer membrane protein